MVELCQKYSNTFCLPYPIVNHTHNRSRSPPSTLCTIDLHQHFISLTCFWTRADMDWSSPTRCCSFSSTEPMPVITTRLHTSDRRESSTTCKTRAPSEWMNCCGTLNGSKHKMVVHNIIHHRAGLPTKKATCNTRHLTERHCRMTWTSCGVLTTLTLTLLMEEARLVVQSLAVDVRCCCWLVSCSSWVPTREDRAENSPCSCWAKASCRFNVAAETGAL